MIDVPLRAIGGGTCLLGVAIAGLTARTGLTAGPRTRFISEILVAFRRRGEHACGGWGWWGSFLATLCLVVGSALFALDGVDQAGFERIASVATGVTLLAVALVPLHFLDQPADATWRDYGHPIAAALFYLAALLLGAARLWSAGALGFALSIVHVLSSCVLIALSIYTSCLELPPCLRPWPPIGTPILLDLRPHSRAEYVRWFQWPATVAVGVALCVGALGY